MKYNIAICGTFNVENYGDLMFPEVFKMAMQKRGLQFEMYMFSPGRSEKKALDPNSYVYSVDEIDEIHKKVHFDAVIIGGGAIIHYNKISVKFQNDNFFSDYKIYDSWYTPIEFAIRNNVKILFNLPQVPYLFFVDHKELAKAAFNSAEYISFRDNLSKEYTQELYDKKDCPNIFVYPDSVCCLPALINYEQLKSIRDSVDDFSKKYAVVQFNQQRPVDEEPQFIEAIKQLQNNNLEVILLPLGYTHNDDNVLIDFNNKHNLNCKIITRKLNIFEMAAILAGCEIYIGSSFHGAITAIAYGKKAISYNYIYPKNKNNEIFKMYGLNDFVVENSTDLLNVLNKILSNKISFNAKTTDVVNLVEEHFDKLYSLITANTQPSYSYRNFITPLLDTIPDIATIEPLKADNERLKLNAQLSDDHINNLTAMLVQKDKELAESNATKDTNIHNLNQEIVHLNNLIADMQRSFYWRLTSPARKLTQKAKNFLSRHPSLLKIFIYLKGFLRGGFKGGTQKLAAYQAIVVEPERFKKNQISDKQRKAEADYTFDKNIKFSILVPLYNTPTDLLTEMIDSVINQTYKNWELCLADGSDNNHAYVEKYCRKLAKKDKRIKYQKLAENRGISENTNACIKMSTGDYIALFDHDDLLHPSALFKYMQAICQYGADFIYCDEDKFTMLGEGFFDPYYKVDFAPDNLRGNNYICHFTVFKKSLLDTVGGFRKEFDGSQDHDLILRLTEKAEKIVHIPEVLYHWRISDASVASDPYAKPYTIKSGQEAVREHLERVGLKGSVESSPFHPNFYRIKYEIKGEPLVSILIPTYNHVDDLDKCIKSIINKSTYKNYEIIIIENNSNEETFEYYETLKKYPQIKIVVYETDKFNYSAINNYGAQYADGEHLIFLNNDVEIISKDWIQEMLMYSQREDIGIVGAKLYYPDDTIQHAGVILGIGGVGGHIFKNFERNNPGYFGRAIIASNYSCVTFACAMMKRRIFDEMGGLDESFEVAFNDVDMCMRVASAGYLNCFTPYAELYHYESKSRGLEDNEEKIKRFQGEIKRFHARWKKELEQGDPFYNPNLTLDREDCTPK